MGRITSASLCAWVMLEYTYLKTEDEGIVGEVFSEASEGQLSNMMGINIHIFLAPLADAIIVSKLV